MACILYNRKTYTDVKLDIFMFLIPIEIDMYIKYFRWMQEKYGLFLGMSEDAVRATYLRYFPGGNFYIFLNMICEMTYNDVVVASTSGLIITLIWLMDIRKKMESDTDPSRWVDSERKFKEGLIYKLEYEERKIKMLKEAILDYKIMGKEEKYCERR